ncbi:YceK/YidQ family lipoprotein [Pseudomonas sp. BJa5]|uniref:YceK/YidQ family lipoprotein n=1 Tax=Pseudomonas sp. BJa5 TaxID=2936270 RepID=UPI002559BEDD|nr:YceK/YidQ family lipoprotein [Pseudomonas sp. BGr12]MDL2419593.1 YceK/YidQ family lipoprotein [Pseudomonas sp. BGr12]
MKFASTLLLSISLTGCGTVNTVFRDDSVASDKLARWDSRCESIPRVYSGVALDFCKLNAQPRSSTHLEGQPSAPLMLVDMAFSGVADTVLLPYSIYLQDKSGNIPKARLQ